MSVPESDWPRWRDALAMTESTNKRFAWGDEGLAVGRWQIHPVFLDRWWGDFNTSDHTSWDDLFEACLKNFFDELAPICTDAAHLAMWMHLHGGQGPGWDTVYGDRFEHFWNALAPKATA